MTNAAGVSAEPEASAEAEAPQAETPAAPPTREEMRERIRHGFATGQITVEEVLADLYASQYWTETQSMPAIASFFNQLQGLIGQVGNSKMGRRMLRRMMEEEGPDGGQD